MQTPTQPPPVPPASPLTRRQLLRRGVLGASGLLLAGCAKAPSGGATSPVSGPQLFVTMTVRGTIRSDYYYYTLFNINGLPGPGNGGKPGTGAIAGPVPVIAPPYGNGFAAGAFTSYVEYNSGVPGGTNFGYFGIDAKLLTPNYIGSSGVLITSQVVNNGNTISFQIPLAQLVPQGSGMTVDQITQIEINFVNTNIITVVGDNFSNSKYFDSLGQPENTGTFANIIARPSGVGGAIQQALYQNADTNIEDQTHDVAQAGNGGPTRVTTTLNPGKSDEFNPDNLDIIDWSIRLNP